MTQKDLTSALVQIHNLIADVAVKGDNAILVGNALQGMRGLIQSITKDGVSPDESSREKKTDDINNTTNNLREE